MMMMAYPSGYATYHNSVMLNPTNTEIFRNLTSINDNFNKNKTSTMIKSLLTILIVLYFTPVFSQWEVKNVDEKADYETIHKIEFLNDSIGYAMGTRGLILRTKDAGETWLNINSNIEGDIVDFAYNLAGEIILTTYLEKGTYKSTDGFNFVQIFGSEWDFPNIEYSKNDNFFLSGAEIIYQSLDQGSTWDTIYDLKQNGFKWGHITDFAFVNQNLGYAVGEGRDEFDNSLFYSIFLKSSDGGNNWNIESQYEWDSLGIFTSVYFSDELTGYIISSGQTLITADGGITWNPTSDMYGAVDLEVVNENKIITVNRPEAYNGDATSTVFQINESFDGGVSWSNPEFRNGAHLESVQFLNDSIGFMAGDYSLILKTTTCGGEIGEGYPWHIFTTSTEDLRNKPILLYPNPASNRLFFDIALDQSFNYVIYEISGKVIEKGPLLDNSIDVTKLNSGIYSISLINKDSFSNLKFIKTMD